MSTITTGTPSMVLENQSQFVNEVLHYDRKTLVDGYVIIDI